jgi:hypothetical protein
MRRLNLPAGTRLVRRTVGQQRRHGAGRRQYGCGPAPTSLPPVEVIGKKYDPVHDSVMYSGPNSGPGITSGDMPNGGSYTVYANGYNLADASATRPSSRRIRATHCYSVRSTKTSAPVILTSPANMIRVPA